MMLRWVMLAFLLMQGPARPGSQFGNIAGRVLNQNGSPAKGMRIGALAVPEGGTGVDSALMSIAETDADGRFQLQEVPAGRYYITAGPLDGLTYFPGAAAPGRAIVVTVEPRADVKGIDFSLVTPPLVRVSGVIVHEDNSIAAPATNGIVLGTIAGVAVGRGGAAGAPVQVRLTGVGPALSAAINADGSFEFRNVRPGTYQAQVLPATLRMPTVSVTVGDTDLANLRLVIPLLVNVTGTVIVEDGGPQPRVQVSFAPVTVGGSAATATTLPPAVAAAARGALQLIAQQGSTNVAAMGSFNLPLPVGEYRLTLAGLPAGFLVKSMTADSINLATDNLKVTATGPPGIRIVLAVPPDAWTKISGRLVGRGAVGFTPNVLLAGGVLNQLEPPAAAVYLDGSFEFPKVLPGRYYLSPITPTNNSQNAPLLLQNQRLTQVDVGATGADDIRLEASLFSSVTSTDRGVNAAAAGARVSGRIVGRARWAGPTTVSLAGGALTEDLVTPLFWDGTFEFPAVPTGTYAASVRPLIPGAKPAMITVAGPAALSNVEIRVPATREVRGRLSINGSGTMPAGAAFVLAAADGGAAASRVAPILPDGSFALTLPEGVTVRYSEDFLPAGYEVESITYGESDLQKQPALFNVPESAELRVRLNAARATAVRISGRVTGATPPGSHVWLTSAGRSIASIETAIQNGAFSFVNVLPGQYTLRIAGAGLPTSVPGMTVRVADKDIAGLELAAPHIASGRVNVKGGGLAPRFSLPLRSESGEATITIDTQQDGSFRVALPVGLWQIGAAVGLPGGTEVLSIIYGTTDISRAAMRVTAADTAEMNISLSR